MKFLESQELFSFLKTKYQYKSLLPAMGQATAPLAEVPVVTLNGSTLSWNAVSGAEKYAVYLLEKDQVLLNTYHAHAVQVFSESQFSGSAGKSYFVTASNSNHIESARSAVFTIK
jgi:hypothetical protein